MVEPEIWRPVTRLRDSEEFLEQEFEIIIVRKWLKVQIWAKIEIRTPLIEKHENDSWMVRTSDNFYS